MPLRSLALPVLTLAAAAALAQSPRPPAAEAWADSVLATLTPEQRIGQLMVVRLSSINTATRVVTFYEKEVEAAVRDYGVGGVCLFQGGPLRQARLVNHLQSLSRVPILMTIDAENGLGMRLDSVAGLPRQMMLGALRDPGIVYAYGRWVAQQCRRMGIQVNYAPVVDVNNNPANPVINDRSFGDDRQRVTDLGLQYMKGMQDAGVMASAKHFPGHGDVSVDSHYDLPVIHKDIRQLDSLELFPFRALIREGVGSVMVAHLSVPAIDDRPNRPSSISYANVTSLLRDTLGFDGLTFTDALEMKGVTKHFPDGEASVEALIAGHDMLCLPGDIPLVVAKVGDAIRKKRLSWATLDARVRKVLVAKYRLGLADLRPVSLERLADDLNRESPALRRRVTEGALTLARHDPRSFPLPPGGASRVALVSLGTSADNDFTRRMRLHYDADVFHFDYRRPPHQVPSIVELVRSRYDVVLVAVHGLSRFPGASRNFGMSDAARGLASEVLAAKPSTLVLFGNPYVAEGFGTAGSLLVCYEDEPVAQDVAADMVAGLRTPQGRLPVAVGPALPSGTGLTPPARPVAQALPPSPAGHPFRVVDSLAEDAIRQRAAPGCVVLVAKKGRIVYQKAFGHPTYDSAAPMTTETLFDMASVTKICATTLSVMKLYDEGRLRLDATLGEYLPFTRGTDKAPLRIRDLLIHQAGLRAFIPFYRETIDTATGIPREGFYAPAPGDGHRVRVKDGMYLRDDFRDTMQLRILQSPVAANPGYVYSDNDFILLGQVVEAVSGRPLDAYAAATFYRPMGLVSPGFNPVDRFPTRQIAPTEAEATFRRSLVHGYVHDPGAALFGGVAGHAGLFSTAHDIAALMQMLLDGGVHNGRRYLSDTTVARFTAYHSPVSRRGLGFDKPEKDNAVRKDPYPTLSASPLTFGHTGFTGTCAWADPAEDLVVVFLSNRVHPDGSNRLLRMNVRSNIHEAVYRALRPSAPVDAAGR
jgi:beta-glucosidase-like glycosyl hydrolase/CubicO group peptidase (beta-lactamase class C family)